MQSILRPYHPWDHSTRGQERNNITDPVRMAEVCRDTGADGFNGDTMGHIPRAFYDAAVRLYRPIAMEPEKVPTAWDANYATIGWGENYRNSEEGGHGHGNGNGNGLAPDVDKLKWITAGKRMTNWCERWARVKIPSIQVR